VAEAVAAAFEDHVQALGVNSEKTDAVTAVREYVSDYLTRRHLARTGFGCPMAALGGDGAREAKPVQEAFAQGTRQVIDMLAAAQTGSPAERRSEAIRLLATIVGAIVMARSVGTDKLGDEILTACRERLTAGKRRSR
jgi:TetR/AcrR family transcriptional repressor of nem operon